MKDFLPAQEVIRLKAAHRLEKDRKRADRIKTLLALNEGLNYHQVAKLLLLDDTTIRQYEVEYKKPVLSDYLKTTTMGARDF